MFPISVVKLKDVDDNPGVCSEVNNEAVVDNRSKNSLLDIVETIGEIVVGAKDSENVVPSDTNLVVVLVEAVLVVFVLVDEGAVVV
ncbi:hypothetical protein V6O07_07680, partial [Arthrospira platensis SPKY2]